MACRRSCGKLGLGTGGGGGTLGLSRDSGSVEVGSLSCQQLGSPSFLVGLSVEGRKVKGLGDEVW